MTCPNCSKPSEEGAAECPACGLVFAKFKARSVERPAAAAGGEPAGIGIGAVSAGLFLLAALFGGYRLSHKSAELPAQASSVTFKPELYKPQILALEASLYRAEPPTLDDAEAISNQAGRIAGAVLAKHKHNPLVSGVAVEFSEYSVAVGAALEGQQVLGTARVEWRSRWEALRAKRFKPAKWFHAPVP